MKKKLFKNALVWTLALSMAVSPIGGGFGVFAEGEDAVVTTKTTTDENGHTVHETTETTKEYKLDDEESTKEEVEATEGVGLEYSKTNVTVDSYETYYAVKDSEGSYVTDEDGNILKVDKDAELTNIKVIEKADGTLETVTGDVISGGFDENGVWNSNADTSKTYVETQAQEENPYKDTVTVYAVENTDGDTVIIDETLKSVLEGAEVDGYTRQETVEIGGTAYNLKDLEDAVSSVNSQTGEVSFAVDEHPVAAVTEKSLTLIAGRNGEKQYTINDVTTTDCKITKEGSRENPKYVVTVSIQKKNPQGELEVDHNGNPKMENVKFELTGDALNYVDTNNLTWKEKVVTPASTSYTIQGTQISVASNNVKAVPEIAVTVEGEQRPILTVDATALKNLQTKHYTETEDKMIVKDAEGNDVIIDKKDWTKVVEHKVTYKEVITYHYISDIEDNYIHIEATGNVNGADYTVRVSFFNSNFVHYDESYGDVTVAAATDENGGVIEGKVKVTIPYGRIALDENGQYEAVEATYETVLDASQFGSTGIASVTIALSEDIKTAETVKFEQLTSSNDVTIENTKAGDVDHLHIHVPKDKNVNVSDIKVTVKRGDETYQLVITKTNGHKECSDCTEFEAKFAQGEPAKEELEGPKAKGPEQEKQKKFLATDLITFEITVDNKTYKVTMHPELPAKDGGNEDINHCNGGFDFAGFEKWDEIFEKIEDITVTNKVITLDDSNITIEVVEPTPETPAVTPKKSKKRSAAAEVLGATRPVEEAGEVLGATRAPKTGDTANVVLWAIVMAGCVAGAVVTLAARKKEEN